MRTFNRTGRGLEFPLLRARLLWFDAFHRTNRWPSFCDEIEGNITPRRFIEAVDARLAARESALAPTGDYASKTTLVAADTSPTAAKKAGEETNQSNDQVNLPGSTTNADSANRPDDDSGGEGQGGAS